MRKFKKIGKMNHGSDLLVNNLTNGIENDFKD